MNPTIYLLLCGSMVAAPPAKNELPEQVRAILEKADSVELYSLDEPGDNEKGETFQGCKVLGKVTIKDEKVRKTVLDQIGKSIPPTAKKPDDLIMRTPWYGVRVTQGKKSVDLLLNFRWSWLTAQ